MIEGYRPTGLGETNGTASSGAEERRPQVRGKILLLVAEPEASLSMIDPSADTAYSVSAQQTAQAHGLPIDWLHPHNLWDNTPIPNLEQFAAVMSSGSSSSVNDGHEWLQIYDDGLRDVVALGKTALLNCHGHQMLIRSMGGQQTQTQLE